MIEISLLRQNFAALLRRCAVDKDFRTLCLQDACKAYLELTGEVLPEKHMVHFCEPDQKTEFDTVRYVRLPKYHPKTWLG